MVLQIFKMASRCTRIRHHTSMSSVGRRLNHPKPYLCSRGRATVAGVRGHSAAETKPGQIVASLEDRRSQGRVGSCIGRLVSASSGK